MIIAHNSSLVGNNPVIEKINVGFTNLVYKIDNKYILKICEKVENENSFQNEIKFYLENNGNNNIPVLYSYSIDKSEIPCFYEIIELLDGISLYSIWHTFNESSREDVVRQLCDILKSFHKELGCFYSWPQYIKENVSKHLEIVCGKGLLSDGEVLLVQSAIKNFDIYLASNSFSFVHNDIHFDNIIYNGEVIKIIDFERSLYAPFDYEFGLFFRMVKTPWKFASEETEKYVKQEDYESIIGYIKKYYPEVFEVSYLKERLAIYDLCYDLELYCSYPNSLELKKQILDSTNIIINNDMF